jgi:hypothetical protein
MPFRKIFKVELRLVLPNNRDRFYFERYYRFADLRVHIRRPPIDCFNLFFSRPFKQGLPNRGSSRIVKMCFFLKSVLKGSQYA